MPSKYAYALLVIGLFLAIVVYGRFGDAPAQVKLLTAPSVFLRSDEHTSIREVSEKNGHPNMYLNRDEIVAIQSMVQARKEPWSSAYLRMLKAADHALQVEPFSVVKNGGPYHGHRYHTESPYCGWRKVGNHGPDCRDGKINPSADREDYREAIGLGHAITNLGLAYAFTRESRYAEKAVNLIRAWCIDSKTRMAADLSNEPQIELSITMPGLMFGADLIFDYEAWPPAEKAEFSQWVRDLGHAAMGWSRLNNIENWKVTLIASAGALLSDRDMLSYAFGRYKELISYQINLKGQLEQEMHRTKSLFYSLYALNSMIQTAEIARHFGVNLYDVETVDGKGLKMALDYYSRFAKSPSAWPLKQIEPLGKHDSLAVYELAYSYWQDPAYLEVIERWGRPMHERRVLNHVTLTHANHFALPLVE